jgi:hypothetical protein
MTSNHFIELIVIYARLRAMETCMLHASSSQMNQNQQGTLVISFALKE